MKQFICQGILEIKTANITEIVDPLTLIINWLGNLHSSVHDVDFLSKERH